eukprot:CAMPEP_0177282642 /NCGR_PEP_ID=MMETSP0367-20130122/71570_1 /TAXON_ID=447022 ORGANISM="Scrippsiella hangoei-like, Strain SHHI-4" /NCGR_SAMPLE_ID=MMETSP0367 /ASSEMBLY_ACC=CAM_ASM_000362 /LENGTH=30 /DNA_ID= /DNA_START= /DNA_END= /DNA_ORIENTATION=
MACRAAMPGMAVCGMACGMPGIPGYPGGGG